MENKGYVDAARLKRVFLEMVHINSPAYQEAELADFVQRELEGLGLKVSQGPPIPGGNCGNVLGELPGSGRAILLSAHMDTVAPTAGIVCLEEDGVVRTDGRTILGADDKAGIAAILEALRVVVEYQLPHPTVYVLFTVAEEVGLLGARACGPLPSIDYGYVLDSDGPPGTIVNGAPYHCDWRVVVHGKAAHAGVAPEEGINAIAVAAAALSKMSFGRLSPETTCNVGIIEGGQARNIVPDTVKIVGEVRSFRKDEVKTQIDQMRAIWEETTKAFGATYCFDVEESYGGYVLPEEHPAIAVAKEAALRVGATPTVRRSGGGSDANIFNTMGIPTVPLGFAARGVHSKEESIDLADLKQVAEQVVEIIRLSAD